MDTNPLTDALGKMGGDRPTAESVVNMLLDAAKSRMSEGGGAPPPTIAAYDGKGIMIVVLDFDSPGGKREAFRQAWEVLMPRNPEFVVVCMDCYTKLEEALSNEQAENTIADVNQAGGLGALRKLGDQGVKEALTFSVYQRGGEAWVRMFPYENNAQGLPVFSEPREMKSNPEDGTFLEDNLGPQEWTKKPNAESQFQRMARSASKHRETIN